MSEPVKVVGKVIEVGEEQTFGANGFRKRVVVVEEPEQKYPNPIPVEMTQDKCSLLDGISVGDMVTVEGFLRGSAWKDRFFLSINGWKINVDSKGTETEERPPLLADDAGAEDEDSDPIPF